MRTTPIRGAALALGLALGVGLLAPVAASAHPLGNFSVNHLAQVRVSADRVDVRYILDEAEIPTFQQRGVADPALLARKRAEVERRLVLTVDGRRVTLQPRPGATITHPMGQGGLRTTRVELPLSAPIDGRARVELRDGTFAGSRRLENDHSPARARNRRACGRPRGRPDGRAAPLPLRAAEQPGGYPRCSSRRRRPAPARLTAPDGARAVAGTEPGARRRRVHGGVQRRRRRRGRPPAAAAWPRSAGAPCTRSLLGTARRWSRPTSSARAGARGTRSRSARWSR